MARLLSADVFIFQDNAQYRPRYFQNRCKLLRTDGSCRWLTLPVHAHRETTIAEATIQPDVRWINKLGKSLTQTYGGQLHNKLLIEAIMEAIQTSPLDLASINIRLLRIMFSIMGFKFPETYRASDLLQPPEAANLPLWYCQQLHADGYLYGSGGGMIRHPPAELLKAGVHVFKEDRQVVIPAGLSIIHYILKNGTIDAGSIVRAAIKLSPVTISRIP